MVQIFVIFRWLPLCFLAGTVLAIWIRITKTFLTLNFSAIVAFPVATSTTDIATFAFVQT